MPDISPVPAGLGLASPQLGPWFSTPVNLEAPRPSDLSVPVSSTLWLPPAAGTLSLLVPATTIAGDETLHHRSLVRLRNAAGALCFGDQPDRMVALFTLLPEVVVRLRQIYLNIPILGDPATESLKRPFPIRFAMLFDQPPDIAALNALLDVDVTDAEDVAMLGLQGSGPFANGDQPMAWLRRPGDVLPSGSGLNAREHLLDLSGLDGRLFAFDELGLPIDPGAVASAFEQLLLFGTNLEAPGVVALPSVDDSRTMHLTNPFGGPPDGTLRGLVLQAGSAVPGVEPVRAFTGALDLSFAAATLQNRPFVRLAPLPFGPYGTTASLDLSQLMRRDCLRVGLADLEALLAGSSRTDTSGAPGQARETTRINLARSTAEPTLLPNHEAVLSAVQTVLDGPDPVTLISAAVNGATGPLAPADLPTFSPADEIRGLTLLPLQGGAGPDTPSNPDWAAAMQAVVQVELDVGQEGAWVRAMPLDFDLDTGERVRMAGGGGRAIAGGGQVIATMLLTLPPGEATPDDDEVIAFDVEIVTAAGRRLIGSQLAPRIARPPAVPGAVSIATNGTFPGSAEGLYVCETGKRITAASTTLRLPSGLSVIAELPGGGRSVLDTGAAPYSLYVDGIGRRLDGTSTLVTTSRLWKDDPEGDDRARLASSGATLNSASRDGFNTLVEAGAPLPLMERYDVLASAAGNGRAEAVVATLPLVDAFHELSPARAGRADEPAASETHAAGVRLSGPAALLAVELANDRRFASSDDLLNAVTNTAPPVAPAAPGAPGPVVALLRTVAAEVEGERQMHLATNPALPSVVDYPFDGSILEKMAWFAALGIVNLPLPLDAGAQRRFQRAADRRVLGATQGFAELAPVVINLIRQAQRFIYIEAPALDAGADLVLGAPLADAINIMDALRRRLLDNPELHVLVCLPRESRHPFAGVRRYRSHVRLRALAKLQGEKKPAGAWSSPMQDRVVVFAPYAAGTRSLRIASTTLVVDDTVAVTGSTGLTRRGLTFDSSVSAAVFDERLRAGRAIDPFRFRQQLIADRLGEKVEHIPLDGRLLTEFVRAIVSSETNRNIATLAEPVDSDPGASIATVLDPDGRASSDFDILGYLTALILDTSIRDALA